VAAASGGGGRALEFGRALRIAEHGAEQGRIPGLPVGLSASRVDRGPRDGARLLNRSADELESRCQRRIMLRPIPPVVTAPTLPAGWT
jgi:hypothetical protein